MDSAFLFWEKYFNNQIEVTWDEFQESFKNLIKQYGQIELDESQLLFIKSVVDPDYRNVIKIGDYLIFYETFWKLQSNRQKLFKNQFDIPKFPIPKQVLQGIHLKVIAIAHGYTEQIPDLFITRTEVNQKMLKQEEIFTIGSSEQCDMPIFNDLQVNPIHCKMVWTPYNLFLIRDVAKSFRTKLRIQQLYLDAYMVIQLSQNSQFKVKFIQPIPKLQTQLCTSQETLKNQIPDLLKQMKQYKSVIEYRSRISEDIQYQEQPQLVIEFIQGPLKGQEFVLKDSNEYMLGNSKHCSIHIPDNSLQKEHCLIQYVDKHWQILNINSQYLDPTQFGTFVLLSNSNQLESHLPSKCHILHDKAQIIVGPYLFLAQYIY